MSGRKHHYPHPRGAEPEEARYRKYMRTTAAQYVRRERKYAVGMPPTKPLIIFEPGRTLLTEDAYYDFRKSP